LVDFVMKTMHWLLTAGALVLAAPLAFTPAFTQDAPKQDAPAAKEEAKPAETAAAPAAEQSAAPEKAKPKRAAASGGAAPGRFKIDPADGKIISPYSL